CLCAPAGAGPPLWRAKRITPSTACVTQTTVALGLLCDNPPKNNSPMRRFRFLATGWAALACAFAWPQAQPPVPARPAPVPLVLAGGTVVDVTDWGRSAKDLPDAIVIVREGRITDVGSRQAVPIPKN